MERPEEGPLTLLSLHLTERLYRRWRGVRDLHLSPVAPSISERLAVYLSRRAPIALAAHLDPIRLQERISSFSKGAKIVVTPLAGVLSAAYRRSRSSKKRRRG